MLVRIGLIHILIFFGSFKQDIYDDHDKILPFIFSLTQNDTGL